MSDRAYPSPYLLIAGRKVGVEQRAVRPVLDPATAERIADLPCATPSDVSEAIAAAAHAFTSWRKVPAVRRSAILRAAATLLRERTAAVASAMSWEQGKPLGEANAEIGWTADAIDWQAEELRRVTGRLIDTPVPGARAMVVNEPIGPVAAFSPWNLPVFLAGRKIATALGAGCTCVIKPAEETPMSTLLLADCFIEAGVPAGALSVLYGDPSAISTQLIASPHIRKISFTGSVEVGRQLGALAGGYVKPITLELGGHAPTIVFDDVDVAAIARQSVERKFANAGQICVAPTRFYVHESIHEAFVDEVVAATRAITVGRGAEAATRMGPLANERRLAAMERLTADAVTAGAVLRTGGQRHGNRGFLWEPTVLADVPEHAAIMNEEPFGPLFATAPFASDDEVIARANRLPLGLAGFVFTHDQPRIRRFADELEIGMLGINTFYVSPPEAPFGGVKDSGYGREGGSEGIQSYLSPKFIHHA